MQFRLVAQELIQAQWIQDLGEGGNVPQIEKRQTTLHGWLPASRARGAHIADKTTLGSGACWAQHHEHYLPRITGVYFSGQLVLFSFHTARRQQVGGSKTGGDFGQSCNLRRSEGINGTVVFTIYSI
jgi:hypothetical protein